MSLYEDLKQFRQKDRIGFHIPGHKGGAGLNPAWVQDAFSLDVTEFPETDDLQCPTGILQRAQTRAAKVLGAERSFFLTNGSSIGLQAAILAVCKPGEKLLTDRTCHKAVASALVLSGSVPVFLSPEFDGERGVYAGITPEKVKKILEEEPDIKGMVLTSPTYYGICSPIREIAGILHEKGRFLIVDEAHGAHFAFHPGLPEPALSQGADAVIQSAHKTLPALGQSSLLHLRRDSLIPEEMVESALRLLMTTSPSYLLMSAMDEAVASMEQEGQALISILLREIGNLKKTVREQGILDFVDEETLPCPQDGMRLVVDFRNSRFSGFAAAELLKEAYGIYPEMADSCHVVLIVTTANTVEELQILGQALLELATPGGGEEPMPALSMPKMAMPPREAWMSRKEKVSPLDALGRIAGDTLAVCPPGAALLLPGQYIDEETLAYLTRVGMPEEMIVLS
ncbi:MAG: aminotransferase class I/II-fold pyridoxal phosphate-dependent enzyme [Clostridia bacterium]|nr:aminotransferase class I/II-fold pyridoxal phosphate-dependent enzyme [Clostridia bacterium]